MNGTALQNRRLWLGGGGILALVLIVASWFLLINPEMSSASDLRSQAADTQTQNDLTAAKNAKLALQSRNIGSLKAKLLKAIDSLPATTGLPSFTQEVTAAALNAPVKLTSIAISSPVPSAAAGAPNNAPTPAAASGTTASGSASSGPVATPSTTASATQLAIPVTIVTAAPLARQAAFLDELRSGARRALVTSTQIGAAGSANGSIDNSSTMTTQVTIFSAPMTPDQLAQLQKMLTAH